MDYFWRQDTPWLVLQLPNGRRTAAPAKHTDLAPDTFATHTEQAFLPAAALPEMARQCQRLRPPRRKQRRR